MSDRCVFVPYREHGDYEWADVVIPEKASVEVIHQLANEFIRRGGPHKVFISSRLDSRFVEFKRYLDEEWGFVEGNYDWGYRVTSSG